MLWLYIHFPRLALEAHFIHDARKLPQLLLKPGQHEIMQCNTLAAELGIKPGMKKKTAFCLLEDAALCQYDSQIEHSALTRLALQCYRFSAQISLSGEQGLLLEIGSMVALFGGLQTYWQQLQRHLSELGFSYQMSTGSTPTAAKLFAEANIQRCSTDTTTDQQALDQLTVNQLNLSHKVVEKLIVMGIKHYAQLKTLPRKELGYRFGADVVEHLEKIIKDALPATRFELPNRFHETLHLSYEAEHAQGLVFPLKRAFANLETYLRSKQLVCEKLLIKLEHRDGRASLLTIPSIQGSYLQKDWLALLQAKLEHTQLINPVTTLHLRAKGFLAMHNEVDDFIGQQKPSDINLMQSLLISRLGDDQVKKLVIQADPRPEVASNVGSFRSAKQKRYQKKWPSFLLTQAQPADINQYRIVQGPERIEGGWWDTGTSRRDYYIAERNDKWFWLFRRDDGQWFLHGLFS